VKRVEEAEPVTDQVHQALTRAVPLATAPFMITELKPRYPSVRSYEFLPHDLRMSRL
jgi:hypothetical protein